MFKTLLTLLRGQAARAGEELANRNALLLLDQQIREATAALDRAKRALALAIAQDQQEERRLEATLARIADLEPRVVAALSAGDQAAARQGADAIAALEADRDAARTARALFAAEIAKLRRHVSQAEFRLAELDRGRRVARSAEAVRDLKRGRTEPAHAHQATLSEAEATLARLRERQQEAMAADEALDLMDSETRPDTVAEKLAEMGFGPRLKPTGEDVLARLAARVTPAPGAPPAAA